MSAPRGLEIEALSIGYRTEHGTLHVLRDIDLSIGPGETVGLVGESGSGKSTLAYAIVRYLSANAVVLGGTVRFQGEDLLAAGEERLRQLRGGPIGIVYQDPATALNPTLRLGEQLIEGLVEHEGLTAETARARARELLDLVKLPDPGFIMARFPHEVSGGEKQRVLIAMACACRPQLMIFDEPTTALDATTSAGILDLIRRLQAELRISVLYITHDLGVVANVAQRIDVIYAGQIVEEGPVADVLGRPRHPYSRMLCASIPNPYARHDGRRLTTFPGLSPDLHDLPIGCIFEERCPYVRDACREAPVPLPREGEHRTACIRLDAIADAPLPSQAPAAGGQAQKQTGTVLEVAGLRVTYGRSALLDRLFGVPPSLVYAVTGIDLEVGTGETVGLVGESGCGKSTLARALVGLTRFAGELRLDGRRIAGPDDMRGDYRRAVQIVFQHPDLSLNPRMSVGEIVGRPIRLYEGLGGRDLRRRVEELLDRVRLPAAFARRYPHELSGGEKQRISIARAFGPRPRLVVCDEITSGLDVTVQASILNLLADLQDEFGTAYVFISHDLNLVQFIADRILVMYLGHLVEERTTTGGQMAPPFHPYTEALMSAVPVPEPTIEARRVRLEGALPSPADPPAGCPFHTRCPRKIGAVCVEERPALRPVGDGQRLACHIPTDELSAVEPIWRKVPDEPVAAREP